MLILDHLHTTMLPNVHYMQMIPSIIYHMQQCATGVRSVAVKCTGSESDYSPLSSADVENEMSCTPSLYFHEILTLNYFVQGGSNAVQTRCVDQQQQAECSYSRIT
jgi:hypothetical protein